MKYLKELIIIGISTFTGKTFVNFLGGTYAVTGDRVWKIR